MTEQEQAEKIARTWLRDQPFDPQIDDARLLARQYLKVSETLARMLAEDMRRHGFVQLTEHIWVEPGRLPFQDAELSAMLKALVKRMLDDLDKG